MKNTFNILLLIAVFGLGSYIIYDKTSEKEATPVVHKETAPQYEGKVAVPKFKVRTFDIPDNFTFAGEKVPINQTDIKERLDREIHVNTYWNSSTVFVIKRAHRWFPLIEPILEKHGIPDDIKYLAVIESSLTNAVSPAKAVGFWQILSRTAKEGGLEVNQEVDERYNPIRAVEVTCQYLKEAHRKFGSWTSAAASYNLGMTGLAKRFKKQQVNSYYDLLLNEETSRYILRAVALKEIMENPEKYGYDIPEDRLYDTRATKEINVNHDIKDLVRFSKSLGINYKILKLYNPWLRQNQLTIKKRGKVYTITVPDDVPDALIAKANKTTSKANEAVLVPQDLQTLNTAPE